MPSKSTSVINTTLFSEKVTTEASGQTSLLFNLEQYAPSQVFVDGISWGCIVPNATDRTNFVNQYIAIFRNLTIDQAFGYSATAPIQDTDKIIWTNNRHSPSGPAEEFDEPLILNCSDKPIIFLPAPALSAAQTATLYFFLSVHGRVVQVDPTAKTPRFATQPWIEQRIYPMR